MEDIRASIQRFDFNDKIEGRAKYCADLHPEGVLYARTLRATVPRAKLLAITLPELPEGYVIVDVHDIPGKNIVPLVFDDEPFFAEGIVNYIGQPILLVVGPDKEVILSILSKIHVAYEPMKPILSIQEAMDTRENFIYGDKPSFCEYTFSKGDPDLAISKAVSVIEEEYTTGYQEHVYLETQAMLAEYVDGKVTVYGSMQCPYYVYDALKSALGWDETKMRVVQLPTGGGFGGKEDYPSIPGVHAALAAIKTGKPVQLIYDRQEDIISTTKRHPSIIRIKSYLDEENTILAHVIDIKADAGAYAGLSSVVLQRMVASVCGVYNIPNLKVTGCAYATNNVVTGAYRGFGGPQAFFAIEMHMDKIASVIQADALLLRHKYFLKQGDTSATGGLLKYPIKLDEILSRLDQQSDYSRKHAEYAQQKKGRGGIGCAVYFHGCGFTGSGEAEFLKPKVRLKKNIDNTVEIFISSTEIGQGVLTTMRKIVANTLEIPIDGVHHTYPDTDDCPDSGPTVASRTVMIVGRILQYAADEMKKRWMEDEFEIIEGYRRPEHLVWDSDRFQGNAYPEFAWAAMAVEVEVDPTTYAVEVKDVWIVMDIGNPIDEKIVMGQIEGGVVQGLGYALLEAMEVKEGKLLQDTLTTYMIPTADDFPLIHIDLIDNPFEDGPFGARGLGEAPLVGVAPAVANAIQNAIGKPIPKIPVLPERIMEVINDGH
ncbi:MAG: aldehyde oxidase [Erysipelotrichales bacterium]|nr:MAG: aldehyde oxidase [Erysipelotrichales bacterium]